MDLKKGFILCLTYFSISSPIVAGSNSSDYWAEAAEKLDEDMLDESKKKELALEACKLHLKATAEGSMELFAFQEFLGKIWPELSDSDIEKKCKLKLKKYGAHPLSDMEGEASAQQNHQGNQFPDHEDFVDHKNQHLLDFIYRDQLNKSPLPEQTGTPSESNNPGIDMVIGTGEYSQKESEQMSSSNSYSHSLDFHSNKGNSLYEEQEREIFRQQPSFQNEAPANDPYGSYDDYGVDLIEPSHDFG